ncbi:MAG TPA: apolipoprotein N-acyltransferase [Bacteroidetes bacterium]|nr:apolipoprotein N-acyltransferase [Bacteroidota bacterium]
MRIVEDQALDVSRLWQRLTLALMSGAMLGFAFPPSPLASLAYVGLIPFLLLVETLRTTWQVLRYSYVMLFVFHALTLYWTGGFTHGNDPWLTASGTALILVHPLFYWPPILLFLFVRRRLGVIAGLASFPFFWIAYEYSHSLGEFSFPWISLGNSQAYDIYRIQIAEFTSTYGLSLLLLMFNILGFVLVVKLATAQWSIRSRNAVVTLLAMMGVYFGPLIFGKILVGRYEAMTNEGALKIGIIQPNIDPWEKWGKGFSSKWDSYSRQLEMFIAQTESLSRERPDLIVWPETAIPFRILLPQYFSTWTSLRSKLDSINVPVFTGLPFTTYYDSATAPLTAGRIGSSDVFYEDFNSAALLVPGQPVGPIYKKIVLVPYGERIPYAESFRFLIEPLKWNVGIGMWGKGTDTVVFALPRPNGRAILFSTLICYESVYPNFVRRFTELGAEFLVIITNDSWWGNTSGAYQHASYASLRAVENRRWIVRVANGGISGFVDPVGRIHHEKKLFSMASFVGEIVPRHELTYYARHGDVFAWASLFCAALFVILSLFVKRKGLEKGDDATT